MEVWQTILLALGGNAAAIGILGWLTKSFIEKRIHRDEKQFESELKSKTDAAIERLKSELQLQAIEHQVRFSRLHEKRAEVIAELSALMVETLWEAESFLSLIEWAGEPNKREKHLLANNKLVDLYRYFDKHRIYLSPELCVSMDSLIQEIRGHVIGFGVWVGFDDNTMPDHARKQKLEAWQAGWEAIRTKIPAARSELEKEFRLLLGVNAREN